MRRGKPRHRAPIGEAAKLAAQIAGAVAAIVVAGVALAMLAFAALLRFL